MRGPCTPSTRSSSMSDVALGPETNVSGRPSAAAGASAAIASGTEAWIARRLDEADVEVGHERERAAAAPVAAVEHDGAGLGDRERAAGEDAVDLVEAARGDRRVVDEQLEARQVVRRAGRDGEAARALLAARLRDGRLERRPRRRAGPSARYSAARSQKRATTAAVARGRPAAGDVVVARDLRHGAPAPSAARCGRGSRRARSCVRAAPPCVGPRVGARPGRRRRRSPTSRGTTAAGTSGSSRIAVQPAQRAGQLRDRAVAGARQPLRALVARRATGTRARARPSPAAPGSSATSTSRTTRPRRCTSTVGMSILTGQTS